MRKLNQTGAIHVIIIALVIIVVVAGVTAVVVLNNNDGDLSVDESSSSIPSDNPGENSNETSSEYPDLYKQYGLPEYPNATITDDGRNLDSLTDGISLRLQTDDDVQTVGQFYGEALAELDGWSFTPPQYSDANVYGGIATKSDEGLRFQLSVTKLNEGSQISITFVKSNN